MTSLPNGNPLFIQAFILLLAALSLGLSLWSGRTGSPVIAIFGRWVRWGFLAALVAGTAYAFNWTGYGWPVLFAVSLLGIFLIETVYNWIAIAALSKSELPLFPKFQENERGEEWPSSNEFIRQKAWLRKIGYQRRQALVSMLGEAVLMRISAYENEERTIRLHVLFLPNPRGNQAVCLTLFSQTREGELLVTDNIFLPFGGFYPETWHVERRPWTRSWEKLLERHKARIDAHGQELDPFENDPLEQINADQRIVEHLNRELGFLHSHPEAEEQGRLTAAGRARIWQEVWTLGYLGLPLRYH